MTSFGGAVASKSGEEEHEQDEKERTRKQALQKELSLTPRALVEAVERQKVGPEGLQATQLHLVNLLARTERLQGQIDQVFGGQAFLSNAGGPTNPANLRRFKIYFEYHRKASRLLLEANQVWH